MAKDCDSRIIDTTLTAATHVHRVLGPGLLESIYRRALLHELRVAGLPARAEVEVTVRYDGIDLGCGMRLDLLVAEQLVLEIKSIARIEAVHFLQLRTYLRCIDVRVGFIMNFNASVLKAGLRRVELS